MPDKPSPFLAAEWPNSELPGASTHRQHGCCALQRDALGSHHTSGRQLGTLGVTSGSAVSHGRAPGRIALPR